MFDTKITIVIRDDLLIWQKLNVTAFLTTGVIGQAPEIIGEPYQDRDGNFFNPLCVQPMIVLAADGKLLSRIHERALGRGVRTSLYVEEMFATSHDTANREAFAKFGPGDAKVVGLSLRADKKIVDKITKGATMHA